MGQMYLTDAERRKALVKIAFSFDSPDRLSYGNSAPAQIPTVGDVLTSLGLAQVHDIGTPEQRRDAMGRIVNSGYSNSSPASKVLGLLGGGYLGNAITGLFTKNPIIKGLGMGTGALIGSGGFGSGHNGFGSLSSY